MVDPFAVARVTVLVLSLSGSLAIRPILLYRSQRDGQLHPELVIEDPVDRGHCQQGAVSYAGSYDEPYDVVENDGT